MQGFVASLLVGLVQVKVQELWTGQRVTPEADVQAGAAYVELYLRPDQLVVDGFETLGRIHQPEREELAASYPLAHFPLLDGPRALPADAAVDSGGRFSCLGGLFCV